MMIKSMNNTINLIILILLLSLSVIVSKTVLRADNNEEENFFKTPPTIKHLSNSSLEVSWNSFPDNNKTTHYQVMINHVYYGHSTKALKQVCNNIAPGSRPEVRVVTFHNGDFRGISSLTSVLMIPAAPLGFSISDVSTASFKILWSGVESATSYNIYNNQDIIASKAESGINNKLTLTGFEPGSLLKIAMTSINSSGESPKTNYVDVQLLPIASLTMKIPNSSITSNSFKIKWTKQAYATGYKIQVNDSIVATLGNDKTEYEVTGLEAGTSVSVKIIVMNSAGEAATGDSIIVQLKPSTPVLNVTEISSSSCTLSWSVSTGANNYKVFENGDNAISNVPSTVTSVKITDGIAPGRTYSYKVRGVNDIGESDDSNIVEVTYKTINSNTEESETTGSATSPIYTNRLFSSSFKIPEAHFSDTLKKQQVIAVYFPENLRGPELALEVEYLVMLSETPELSDIRFYGIFTDEFVRPNKTPKNLRFKKSNSSDNLIIPGKIPVVRFYAEGGILRSEILISIPIMTTTDVYKALPEVMEKRSNVLLLYHEK